MLKIEKWVPAPETIMIEVVKFKGGEDHAYEIIQWILDNGSHGLHSPARQEADLEIYGEPIHIEAADEEIIIEKDGRFCKAVPGMYVCKSPENMFFTATKDDLLNVFIPGGKPDDDEASVELPKPVRAMDVVDPKS